MIDPREEREPHARQVLVWRRSKPQTWDTVEGHAIEGNGRVVDNHGRVG
jgi:hypothetical protein